MIDTYIVFMEKDVAELKKSQVLLTKSCEGSGRALILNSQINHLESVMNGVKIELDSVNREFKYLGKRASIIERLEPSVAEKVKEAFA